MVKGERAIDRQTQIRGKSTEVLKMVQRLLLRIFHIKQYIVWRREAIYADTAYRIGDRGDTSAVS